MSAANSPAAPAPTTTRSGRTRRHGITVCAMEERSRRVLWLRDDDVSAHDVPNHPERPARIRALEAEMSAHGWFGALRVQAPEVERAVLHAVHPDDPCGRAREAVRERRRPDRHGHVRRPRDLRRGAASSGRSGRAGRRAARRRRGRGRQRAPPSRSPRRGASRAMGFCFFNNAAVARAPRDCGARPRARDDRRLGRPPRQRDQRPLPRRGRRPLRVHPRVPAVPRHGAGVRRRLGRGTGVHGQPAGAGRHGRSRLPLARRARGVRADPGLGAAARARSRPGSTPTATIRWPPAG